MTKLINNTVKDIIDADDYEVPMEVSETEAMIYDWVAHTYGENEASNPSWDIHNLAKYLDDLKELQKATNAEYKPSNTVKYQL